MDKKASPTIAKTKYVVAPNGKRVPVPGQKSRDIIKAHEVAQEAATKTKEIKEPLKVDLTKKSDKSNDKPASKKATQNTK